MHKAIGGSRIHHSSQNIILTINSNKLETRLTKWGKDHNLKVLHQQLTRDSCMWQILPKLQSTKNTVFLLLFPNINNQIKQKKYVFLPITGWYIL